MGQRLFQHKTIHKAEEGEDQTTPHNYVEELMYKYKSDKSRDDHSYVKLYNMIFANNRYSTKNMTEIGIAAGQSLQAWYRYFPNAEIHAFDLLYHGDIIKNNLDHLKPRVKTHIVNILDNNVTMSKMGFMNESMDIIIDDGPHTVYSQEASSVPHAQQQVSMSLD